jgi:hypothetical protein
MKDTIYLRVSRVRVEGMTKSMPGLHRGEIPVKIQIEIEPGAFREPVIEKQIHITDWREGIDFADVELKEATITEAEAEMIRQRRVAELIGALQKRGYTVTPPPEEEQDER